LLGGFLRIELSCIQVRSGGVFQAEHYVILCAAGYSTSVCVCVCFVRNDVKSSLRDAATVYRSGSDVVVNTAMCVS
jgi:hypothetical protein